uniref:Uncharacterized protein n=1 Tax=virus sp. ctQ5V6 TaxID=2825815 RepID=A0A8S5RQ16_9VIRU|nr:MAG TPA: hypothetical protein [virus sp. ctQ5V6]
MHLNQVIFSSGNNKAVYNIYPLMRAVLNIYTSLCLGYI